MKTESNKYVAGGAAQRQGRKKKRMLIALAGITLLTWSRTLLGDDAEPAAKTAALAAGSAATSAAAAGARPAARSIATFEQAMERMKLWPAALERRSLEGAIADLSPAYWTSTLNTEPEPEKVAAAPAEPTPAAAPTRPPAFEEESARDLPLTLRSTALLGKYRFAVLGNTRYAEGDRVPVPGFGDLLLESVRSREAVLRKGQRTWTLTIVNVSNPEGV